MKTTEPRKPDEGKDAKWPILEPHEKPAIMETGLPGAARYMVLPTPGLSEVSGVRDEIAAGAIGKLVGTMLIGDPKGHGRRILALLGKLRGLPPNAKIYLERTGKGYPFYRVKYRRISPETGRSEVVSIYLGRPNGGMLRWMEAIILEDQLNPESNFFVDPRQPTDSAA